MLVCDLCLLNPAILAVSRLSGVLGALGQILLSCLVHMHSCLRSLRQGQVHVGPITWEVLRQRRRLSLLRSYAQGSFGSIAEKVTDLKGKGLSSPHRFVYKSIVNVKGMTVISHRLRPVPINRWTVPPYCSRWLVLAFASRLYFFAFYQAEGTFIIQYCFCLSMII